MRKGKEIKKQVWQRLRRNNLKCMKGTKKNNIMSARKRKCQKELVKLGNHWLRQLAKHKNPCKKEFL